MDDLLPMDFLRQHPEWDEGSHVNPFNDFYIYQPKSESKLEDCITPHN